MKTKIRAIQKKLGVEADGIVGPKTVAAIMEALDVRDPAPVATWPTQAQVRSGKSVFGQPGSHNLVRIVPPYPVYYDGAPVSRLAVHKAVADAVQSALQAVLDHYGWERIHALGLDIFGGCYNYRQTTGGGSLSMHAWGIALDWMPDGNEYSKGAPEAVMSGPDYAAWWDIWERHGAVSLGRACNKDWMHVQFARIK